MKFQPNRDYKSNDEVMTPLKMAEKIVKHFNPTGKILEPCCGDGSFLRFLNGADWCEITKGSDFMEVKNHYEWIEYEFDPSQIKKCELCGSDAAVYENTHYAVHCSNLNCDRSILGDYTPCWRTNIVKAILDWNEPGWDKLEGNAK